MVLPNYRLVVVSVLVFFLFYVHMYIYLHIDSFYYSYLSTKCNQAPPRQRFRFRKLNIEALKIFQPVFDFILESDEHITLSTGMRAQSSKLL